jgi:hypothetical protein
LSGSLFDSLKTVLMKFSRCYSSSAIQSWISAVHHLAFQPYQNISAGRVFNDINELLEVVIEFFNEIQPFELQLVSHHWIDRVKQASANHGDYYHE